MPRALKIATLDKAATAWAGHFLLPSQFSKNNPEVAIAGREWALQNLYNADYTDEFAHLLAKFRKQLGPDSLADFEKEAKDRFTPRDPKLFADLLAEKLAIDPEGKHLAGKIGTVQLGRRRVGTHVAEMEHLDSIWRRRRLGLPKTAEHRVVVDRVVDLHWPIYAGEAEEREAKSGVADSLPHDFLDRLWRDERGALNTNVGIAFAIAGLDAAIALLDEGSAGAVIQIRSDSVGQPVDPDAAITGVNLATLTCNVVAFGAASDDSPGAIVTAAAITDDSSADATGTADHFRASSSNAADTPLNDHIDGSVGLIAGTFDMEFNTAAFVSGAVIAVSAWTATQPQGPTAT